LSTEETTVAQLLRECGHGTGHIGKWQPGETLVLLTAAEENLPVLTRLRTIDFILRP